MQENGFPKSRLSVVGILNQRMSKPTSDVSLYRYERKNGLPKIAQLSSLAQRVGITEAEMTAGYLGEVLLRVVAGRAGCSVEEIVKAVTARNRALWGDILAAVERSREET